MSVLDSSALLAFLLAEPGGDRVQAALEDREGTCSAVVWSEVAQKVRFRGIGWRPVRSLLINFGITVEPVTIEDAEAAAELWRAGDGLSLADRLCLALGARLGATVLTADRAWAGREGVTVIR